jgi:hypothetical protein
MSFVKKIATATTVGYWADIDNSRNAVEPSISRCTARVRVVRPTEFAPSLHLAAKNFAHLYSIAQMVYFGTSRHVLRRVRGPIVSFLCFGNRLRCAPPRTCSSRLARLGPAPPRASPYRRHAAQRCCLSTESPREAHSSLPQAVAEGARSLGAAATFSLPLLLLKDPANLLLTRSLVDHSHGCGDHLALAIDPLCPPPGPLGPAFGLVSIPCP